MYKQEERQRKKAEPDVGAQSHDPEIMTCAEIKSWMLNQLSHPGTQEIISFKSDTGDIQHSKAGAIQILERA